MSELETNIKPLREGQVNSSIPPEPAGEVVQLLTGLLEEARLGTLRSIAFTASNSAGRYRIGAVGFANAATTVGWLETLKVNLLLSQAPEGAKR